MSKIEVAVRPLAAGDFVASDLMAYTEEAARGDLMRSLFTLTALLPALLPPAYAACAPPVVTAPDGAAPSDAVVLFDGKNLNAWEPPENEEDSTWKVADGALVVTPGAGNLTSKRAFGHVQLHLEFRTPAPPVADDLQQGNSGVLFMGRYELQILDSYNNPVASDLQAAAIYKQRPPLVNASRPPGEWQTLDVLFYAPRPRASSVLAARMTVLHNGVLVQNDAALLGQTGDEKEAVGYERHPEKLPLVLQDAGSVLAFRNIWVRELAFPDGEMREDEH